jgi:FkbM family methyltransferase
VQVGVVRKNIEQGWDRACRLFARIGGGVLPDSTAEEFRPVFLSGFGETENRLLLDVLSLSGMFQVADLAETVPTLIKRLRKHNYRSWRHLAKRAAGARESSTETRARLSRVPSMSRSLAALIDALAGPAAESARWGAWFEGETERIKRVLQVFPDARFVCLLRDGVDAVAAQLEREPGTEIAALGMRWTGASIAAARLQDTQPETILTLRFEDLLACPAQELERTCSFLGIAHESSMDRAIEVARAGTAALAKDYGRNTLGEQQMIDLVMPFTNELTRRGYARLPSHVPHYYSQYGQDRYLAEQMFPGRTDGFFVDIGAHDGVTFSNSLHFERLGWKGICIEPNPEVFKQLRERRSCECLNTCVSEVSGEVEFNMVVAVAEGDFTNMLSGIHNKYDKRHMRRFEREVAETGGRLERVKVPSRRFNECVPAGTRIDFVSIDTEGAELAVLQSIDFDAVDIQCFVIENNYGDASILDFMKARGYSLKTTLKVDQVYVRDPG